MRIPWKMIKKALDEKKDNIDIYGNQMVFNKNEIIDNFFTPNDN